MISITDKNTGTVRGFKTTCVIEFRYYIEQIVLCNVLKQVKN